MPKARTLSAVDGCGVRGEHKGWVWGQGEHKGWLWVRASTIAIKGMDGVDVSRGENPIGEGCGLGQAQSR